MGTEWYRKGSVEIGYRNIFRLHFPFRMKPFWSIYSKLVMFSVLISMKNNLWDFENFIHFGQVKVATPSSVQYETS